MLRQILNDEQRRWLSWVDGYDDHTAIHPFVSFIHWRLPEGKQTGNRSTMGRKSLSEVKTGAIHFLLLWYFVEDLSLSAIHIVLLSSVIRNRDGSRRGKNSSSTHPTNNDNEVTPLPADISKDKRRPNRGRWWERRLGLKKSASSTI